ncbi:hypothetical protein WICPIJ_005279 [Wickerhamomyces pijperi]|uniref:Vacuolar sorting protein 39/Transforming growth factor beta receptor-associated domain-containing protein n=1 Tax=Wickerhamomyces pijperi TaxID=599730 RepID=A0A9P8Q610_WICPI|nr:hypothetical protein WICPIJ_005279 [Wickerhamomyces pijperi]
MEDASDYQILTKLKTFQLPSQQTYTSILRTDRSVIVGSKDGWLLEYDADFNHERTSKDVIKGSIDSILMLNKDTLVIVHDTVLVSLYDVKSGEVVERLPFKDITDIMILRTDNEEDQQNSFAVSTKNTVLVYQYNQNYQALDMIQQYKAEEKIIKFKLIQNTTVLIILTNSGFYYMKVPSRNSGNQGKFQRLDFNSSRYSIFNQVSFILETCQDQLLISKGSQAQLISSQTLELIAEFSWDRTPKIVADLLPFLLTSTGSDVHVKDLSDLSHQLLSSDLQIVSIAGVQSASVFNLNQITILTSNGSIEAYEMAPIAEIISQISSWDLEKAISLLKQLNPQQLEKFEMLRGLQIRKAIKLFHHGGKDRIRAMDMFMKYVAPPLKVIKLFPDLKEHEERFQQQEHGHEQEEHHLDKTSLNLLAQYLTDSRRKLTKLLNSGQDSIPYDEQDGLLKLSYFTDNGKQTVDFIKSHLDTTLFLTYSIINPGLIGSLVRVGNDCDHEVIIHVLKTRKMNSELIDYYYKQAKHEEALELLLELYPLTVESQPIRVIGYLQRLKNEDLDVILKYSKLLIDMNKEYAVKIFVDSPYADSFRRITVWEFLTSFGDQLVEQQRGYLEFLLFELNEKSQYFANQLIDLYWKDCERFFDKLECFLAVGNYELNYVLVRYLSKSKDLSKHQLVLKVSVLKRLNQYKEALNILVTKLQDIETSIRLILQLFTQNNPNADSILLSFIDLLIQANDKPAILKALTILSNTRSLNIPLLSILQSFEKHKFQLQIQEMNQVLIKYLRNNKSQLNNLQLSKDLLSVDIINTEFHKLQYESKYFEVTNNASKCLICSLDINNNSMLAFLPSGNLIHLGCLKTYEELKDMNKPRKLKVKKLKDYIP